MNQEKKCKSCLLHDKKKQQCKVAVLINGEETHLPVFPNDNCHFIELGISAEQVRWFEEDVNGKKVIKMEYPTNFFGDT